MRGGPRSVTDAPLGSYTVPPMRPLWAAVVGCGSVSAWLGSRRRLPAPRVRIGGLARLVRRFLSCSSALGPLSSPGHQECAMPTVGTGRGRYHLPAEAYSRGAVGRVGIVRLGPRRAAALLDPLSQRSRMLSAATVTLPSSTAVMRSTPMQLPTELAPDASHLSLVLLRQYLSPAPRQVTPLSG